MSKKKSIIKIHVHCNFSETPQSQEIPESLSNALTSLEGLLEEVLHKRTQLISVSKLKELAEKALQKLMAIEDPSGTQLNKISEWTNILRSLRTLEELGPEPENQ